MNTRTSQQQQNNQSCLVQLDSKGNIQWILPGSNHIQVYGTELWETISAKDTVPIYKQAFVKTWRILKYLLLLFLFAFLFGIAFIIAFWGIGFTVGEQFQKWLDNDGQARQAGDFTNGLLGILRASVKKLMDKANNYVAQYLPGWKPPECSWLQANQDRNKELQ
jgi:hypothetical protein